MMKLMRTSKRNFRQIATAIDDLPRHLPRGVADLAPLYFVPRVGFGDADSCTAVSSKRHISAEHAHEIDVTQWYTDEWEGDVRVDAPVRYSSPQAEGSTDP